MFIDIDYSKRVSEAHYYLAKPNKQVIASISEAQDDNVAIKLGGISEMSLSIPYYIEENFEMVRNPNVALIKERMLIKAVIGKQTEWFLIDEINESGSDVETFTITAFSLGYELSNKLITLYETESANPMEILNEVLRDTAWTIKSIEPKFLAMYRSFDKSGSNALECVLEVAEAFNGILIWDTLFRQISLVDAVGYGRYRGMAVDYGRLLESVSVSRASESLVTRLYVEGAEGMSIQTVNPTGQNYIEDYSYFMYGFKQDATGKVISSSEFMSDALCIAILKHQKLVKDNAGSISKYISDGAAKRAQVVLEETTLAEYLNELDTILNLLDVAKSTEDAPLIATRTAERNAKQAQVNSQTTKVQSLRLEYVNLELKLTQLYTAINRESNFTPALIKELSLYTLERQWSDDRYIDPKELYEEALVKFKEQQTPTIVMTVDVVNFLEVVEEEYYWDKLVLGDLIKVKHPRMNLEYFAKIMEINFDFGGGSISLTIANTMKTEDENERLSQIIRDSASATTLLNNSKYKWDKTNENMSLVEQMINGEWDATKRKILAGVDNQIEIGKRGIIVRNPQFPAEVIVIQSGVIALSKDNGESWKTAITPDGIVAERLLGQIIAGQNLLITNQAGTFVIDNRGLEIDMNSIRISAGGQNAVDNWNQNISDMTDMKGSVSNLHQDLLNLGGSLEETKGDIADEFSVFRADFVIEKNRINMVVSESNQIRATDIASAISITPNAIQLINQKVTKSGDELVSAIIISPEAINILSTNLNLSGLVTFSTFDASLKTDFNTFNGWRYGGTTTINGGAIQTETISADKIKTNELIVGDNIEMGPDAVISWSNVTSKPTASDIGALPANSPRLTHITSTGIYTGSVEADNITAGTISGVTVDATNAGMTNSGTSSSSVRIWAGSTFANRASAPFRVFQSGAVSTSNIEITGGEISGVTLDVGSAGMTNIGTTSTSVRIWAGNTYANRGSAPFRVLQNGVIYASNIQISGGDIGGVTIDVGNAGMTAVGTALDSVRFWAGTTYANRYGAPFQVLHNGTVKASKLDMMGGSIRGGTIDIDTDAKIGYILTIGDYESGYNAIIRMPGVGISSDGWNLSLSSGQAVSIEPSSEEFFLLATEVNFANKYVANYLKLDNKTSSSIVLLETGGTKRLHLSGGASGQVQVASTSGGETFLRGTISGSASSQLKWTSGGLQVKNASDGAFASISASAFVENSHRESKTDIQGYDVQALTKVKQTKVYDYQMKGEPTDLPERRIGLILDEAPPEIAEADGINVYGMNALLWKAVQELSAQVEELRATIKRR